MAMVFAENSLEPMGKFHFEYSLELQRNELEGEEYTSYGVSVKMVGENAKEAVNTIQDITLDPKVAHDLLQLLDSCKISPMCLKMFVMDFLNQ